MTSTNAGSTPANNAVGPSSLNSDISVARVDGFFLGLPSPPGSSVSCDSDCRAVIRVLTTQIGFVMSTVALPAMAPAIIDSTVVSLEKARADLIAARSKKERVHSYPFVHR